MASIYPTGTNSSAKSSANMLRISGMASGIDTDAVVKSMVSNYQAKIDKANGSKQILQWQQEGYREIIKGIKGLQDYFDPLSSKYMLTGKSFNTNTVTNSDSAIVTGAANSSAKPGTYKVDVQKMAEQAKIVGDSNNSIVKVTDLANWRGGTLKFKSINSEGISVDSSINLSPISDLKKDSPISSTDMADLAADINKQIAGSDLNGKISASYVSDGNASYIKFTKSTATTDSITLNKTDSTVSEITKDVTINSGISSDSKLTSLDFAAGNISFNIMNGTTSKDVEFTAEDSSTVQDLMDQVNSATDGSVTMSIDDTTGKISFQSKNYGSSSSLKITDIITDRKDTVDPNDKTDSIITKLGLTGVDGSGSITGTGKDAIVAITAPGQSTATTTTQSSNKFTVNGVAYNIVSEGNSTVTVTSNSDTVVSNMKKFVEDYNTILSTINTKLTEKRDKNYTPLTDEQKTSMSEDQIKTWEAKAKVGILRKDDNLSRLMTQLRGTLYSPVYSSYDSKDSSTGKVALNFGSYGTGAIGIETSSVAADVGKLVINETKLKNAIENNMDDFKKLFIGTSSSTLDANETYEGSEKYKEDGIFTRMDSILENYVASPGLGKDGTYTLSGSMNIFVNKQYDNSISGFSGKNTLPDQVYSKVLSVSRFQTQLEDASSRYYAKFTALETAMNALNSQQSALASMMGTGA